MRRTRVKSSVHYCFLLFIIDIVEYFLLDTGVNYLNVKQVSATINFILRFNVICQRPNMS